MFEAILSLHAEVIVNAQTHLCEQWERGIRTNDEVYKLYGEFFFYIYYLTANGF
jgi:hypothetical protein